MASILIVDDQPCVRALLSEELVSEGHQTTSAKNVASLMRHLRSSEFDLVLLDLYLDGSDGFALLGNIKREYPDLPVIIVTAYDSFENDPRLSDASGYVIKSSDLSQLKETIANVLPVKKAVRTVKKDRQHVGHMRLVGALQPR